MYKYARQVVAALAIGSSFSSNALDDDPIELPRVIITGAVIWNSYYIIYDASTVAEANAWHSGFNAYTSQVAFEDYQEWRQEIADATRNPIKKRCSL